LINSQIQKQNCLPAHRTFVRTPSSIFL